MIQSNIEYFLDLLSPLGRLRRRAIEIGGDLAAFLEAASLEFAGSKTALVIGNGPSTRNLDFGALSFMPIASVGMNAAYRYWYEIDFRPTHYICMDDFVVRSHAKEIRDLVLEGRIKKFFLRDDIIQDCPDLANKERVLWYSQVKDHLDLFKTNYITTGSWAIRWMAYEGIDLIGTIGIDANYVEILPDAQRIGGEGSLQLEIRETPKENPNYFFRDYQRAGDRHNVPNSPDYLQKTGRLLHVDALRKAHDDIVRIVSDCQIFDMSDISNHGIFRKMALPSFFAMAVADAVTSFHQQDLVSLKNNVLIALANALNPFLAHVTVLYEGDEASIGEVLSSTERDLLNELRALGRLRIHLADERPHYGKLFGLLHDSSGGASLGVVANSDIVLPCQSLAAVMRQRDRGWKGLLALTRWNRTSVGFRIQGLSASPPWPTTELAVTPATSSR